MKTSYQKLKDENTRLKEHIHALVMETEGAEQLFIYYRMSFGIEDFLMMGDGNSPTPTWKEMIERKPIK